MALIPRTGQPAQSQSLEAVMDLQVCKAHLDLFALITRFLERRCSIERTCMIAGILVDVARHYALWSVGAALGLERARAAVVGARRIAQHVAGENVARRLQRLARGQTYMLQSLSNLKSLRENVPSSRRLRSRTGM